MLKQKKDDNYKCGKFLEKTLKCQFEALDEGIWPWKSVEMRSNLKDHIGIAVNSLRCRSL